MKIPPELKIKYLNRKLEEIGQLRSSLDREDYSVAMRVGHQVKGNAVTFEVPQIAYIGLEMEQAAQRRDKHRINILIAKLELMISLARQSDTGLPVLNYPIPCSKTYAFDVNS